ncbi:hypothetical protein ACVMIX_006729 [Rhizobium leguminosarum]
MGNDSNAARGGIEELDVLDTIVPSAGAIS